MTIIIIIKNNDIQGACYEIEVERERERVRERGVGGGGGRSLLLFSGRYWYKNRIGLFFINFRIVVHVTADYVYG